MNVARVLLLIFVQIIKGNKPLEHFTAMLSGRMKAYTLFPNSHERLEVVLAHLLLWCKRKTL